MRVVVIGAGLAGLMAAQQLHNNGHSVVVLDKGKSPGGRLATRRIGDATLDHGAQFFTVREPEFEHVVQQWVQAGVVRVSIEAVLCMSGSSEWFMANLFLAGRNRLCFYRSFPLLVGIF